jgi:hypothetical protein
MKLCMKLPLRRDEKSGRRERVLTSVSVLGRLPVEPVALGVGLARLGLEEPRVLVRAVVDDLQATR